MARDSFTFDGTEVPFSAGQSVAAALWAAGVRSWRTTRLGGAPRGIFCGIGACFDCLATVDGATGQRLCITPARPGASVSSTGPAVATGGPGAGTQPAVHAYDLLVVGGGPAGMAAAATAGLAGARVALLDAAPRLGGQFWRHHPSATGRGQRDWNTFLGLRSLVEERVDHVPEATVWFGTPGLDLHTGAGVYRAPRVVLATGAYDRVYPFPGWELPGVLTAGAAQALLKGSGVAVGRRVVVAGAGPFLLPVAVGLAEAGVRVLGVFEAGDPRGYLTRAPGAAGLLGLAGKLPEAAGYAARLARLRVPYRTRHAVVAAHPGPDGALSTVDVARLDRSGSALPRSVHRLACDALAVGHGFTANLELALALGCDVRLGADGGLAVVVDGAGRTTVPGVYAAGELTGIGGSALAVVEGQLAGDTASRDGGSGALSNRDRIGLAWRRDRLRAFADLMHAAHRPPAGWPAWLTPSTVVCRCEEVPVAAVEDAIRELGATDGRSVKLLARPGMGWCQGRTCGPAVAALTARACGRAVAVDDLTAFAGRPFSAPVRLGDLAHLDESDSDPRRPEEPAPGSGQR